MQTLPQPTVSVGEARPVSEILSRADPADMPAMRAGLSFLTSAGAELAAALERSNQENQRLMAIVSALPPEWVRAATTGEQFPDIGSLRAELELAKDERIDLHGQLVERDRQIAALQEQINLAPTAPRPAEAVEPAAEETAASSAEIEQLNAQLVELRGELESTALARAQAEDDLRTSEAELGDFENRLVDLRSELVASLPEEVQAQLPAAPAEVQVQDSRQRRAMRLGALAAAISTLIDRNRQDEEQLQAANAQIASAREEFEVSSADRMAMEADLQEKVQTLEDQQTQIERLQSHEESLTAQIEELTEQVTQLQAELDNTLAAKAQVEEQLQQREGELAELNQQIDSVAQQLTAVLPEDVVAQLTVGEEAEAEAAPVVEGEVVAEEGAEGDMPTRRAAPKMLGLGALATGVAAAVDLSSKKSSEAADASGQLAAVVGEKTTLEETLAGKEQALAELNSQIEALTAQGSDLQAQLDAAAALKADLEQQLGERDQRLAGLNSQVDDAVVQLRSLLPEEDLAALEAPAPAAEMAVEGEAAVEGEVAVEGVAAPAETAARPVGLAALVAGVAGLLSRKDGSVAELSDQLQTMQVNYEDLGQERLGLEATLAEKSQQLVGYNDYVLSLQGQVNELAAEKSAVEAELQLQSQAKAEVEAQIEGLNVQIGDLTAQVETLNAQIVDLQAQLDASNAAKADLEQTLQATQAQLEAGQAEQAQIDEESERTLGEKAVRLGAVGAGAAAVADIRDKDEELAAATEQIAALQQQVDDLTAGSGDVAALQAQLAELADAKASLEAERDGITASKAELEAGLAGKDAELADLRSQLEALQLQAVSVAEERTALQEQLVEMQGDLGDAEALRSAASLSDALSRLPAIKKHAVTASIVAGVQPTLSPRIQALNDVKGIGSAYQQRLYKAGIGTYWELASVPDADLETALQIPELQRARIDFDETRADAYEWAKLTDTVGLLWDGDHVDDFEALPSIGKTFEKRLYEAGITTYEQLAECDVERLAEIIKPPPMREVNYDDWKERARQILAERAASQPADPDQPVG